jgi:Asp/Glu/hydantoin racemase
MRIWWQSFVDPAQNAPHLERLTEYLSEIAEQGRTVDVHGMTPPDGHFGRLTELRCAVLAVDAALEAAEQEYDGFVLGHFQDAGLYEVRSGVCIPAVGLGETSLHWASQLGRRVALISIDPVFEVWHREQADVYGLGERVSHVAGLGVVVEDFGLPSPATPKRAHACSPASASCASHSSFAALTSSFLRDLSLVSCSAVSASSS